MTVGVVTIAAYPESKAGHDCGPGSLSLVPGTAADLPEFKLSVSGVSSSDYCCV